MATGADGEMSVVGIYNGGQRGLDVYTDINDYPDEIPGVFRPPLMFDRTQLWPWRRRCAWDGRPLEPVMIVQLSLQAGDFDGDGDDDAFFEIRDGAPRVLLSPDFDELQTTALGDTPPYPYSIVTGAWDGEVDGLAAIDEQLRLRTFTLEGSAWTPGPLPDLSLAQYDPMWGVPDLDALGEGGPNFVTDRLLRPADLDGDGRSDLLGVLSQNLLFAINRGDRWDTTTVAFADLQIPNERAYRESLILADVAPHSDGDELIARDPCGLIVYGHGDEGLTELYRQTCGEAPWVVSDANGYGTFNRWQIAAGRLDDDDCLDLMVRSPTRLYPLLSSCDPLLPLGLTPGANPGASWLTPFGGFSGWGLGDHGGRFRLTDLDGDGRDDVVGNGPYGLQARANRDDGQSEPAYHSVGGLHPDHVGATRPLLPIDGWPSLQTGDFGAAGRQLLSLRNDFACLELIGLY